MDSLDTMRMRLGEKGRREPDKTPKRYAPYPVWSKTRAIGASAGALYLLAPLLFFVTGSVAWFFLWLPALVIAPPVFGMLENGFTAFTAELVGSMLGSRFCPDCGQSIFDDSPPSGYFADTDRLRWWPNRDCANCGHDLRRRVVG